MDWINYNYQWLFSGIGVFILTIMATFVKWLIKKQNKEKKNIEQKQESGNNSINIQAGRDIKT